MEDAATSEGFMGRFDIRRFDTEAGDWGGFEDVRFEKRRNQGRVLYDGRTSKFVESMGLDEPVT
jgi:hypothetical protein